jgi:eukaryotic-like serine/threonine-protein kinase
VLALIGGVIATAHQAKIARVAQARAEAHFADVRKLANSYLFDVHDAVKNLPGATPVREMLVKNSVAYLDRLAQDAAEDASLIAEIASGYDRLGDVQGAWRSANLGDAKGAETSFRKAIELRERAIARVQKLDDGKAQIETQRLLIVNHGKLSELLISGGRSGEGLVESERALRLSETLAQHTTASLADKLNVVRGRFSLASQRISLGVLSDGASELKASLGELAALHRANPDDKLIRRVGAAMFNQAGAVYLQGEAPLLAKTSFVEALRLTEMNRQYDPGTPQFERMKTYVELHLAEARFRANELSLAATLAEQEKAMPMAQALFLADPKNRRYAIDVALVRQWVADKQSRRGDFDRALTLLNTSEAELTSLSTQGDDVTARANLHGVRFQTRYVEAMAVISGKLARERQTLLCAKFSDGEGQAQSLQDASFAESKSVLPAQVIYDKATFAARSLCMSAAR